MMDLAIKVVEVAAITALGLACLVVVFFIVVAAVVAYAEGTE